MKSGVGPAVRVPVVIDEVPPKAFDFSEPVVATEPADSVVAKGITGSPDTANEPSDKFLVAEPAPLTTVDDEGEPVPVPIPYTAPYNGLHGVRLQVPITRVAMGDAPVEGATPDTANALVYYPDAELGTMGTIERVTRPVTGNELTREPVAVRPDPTAERITAGATTNKGPTLPGVPKAAVAR